jgi:hypothetical protein
MPTATEKLTLKAALALLKPVIERDEALEQRVKRYLDTLSPYTHSHERRPPTADELLEAEAFLAETKVEFAKTRLERKRLEAECERLRLAEREKFRAECIASERKDAKELEQILLAAIVVSDRLKAKEQNRHEMLGGEYVERASWMSLGLEDGSYFRNWQAMCRANGLLD